MNKKLRANIMLVITAFIWGTAFVAQKGGMDYVGPFTFGATRMMLGAIALIPVIIFMDKKKEKAGNSPQEPIELPEGMKGKSKRAVLLLSGLATGGVLFAANTAQQIGIIYTEASKSGFLTALYIVIVPLASAIIFKRRVIAKTWLGVGIAMVGLFLLCILGPSTGRNIEVFEFNKGDLLMIVCAFMFAGHILVVDHFVKFNDPIKLSALQFGVMSLLSWICAFIFETPNISEILSAWFTILYTGVLSASVAYTFQVIAQKDAEPATACLIMSLESVFSAIGGVVVLKERMSIVEWIGCAVMFAAIIITQLPEKETEPALNK